jgi:hypothetical protein
MLVAGLKCLRAVSGRGSIREVVKDILLGEVAREIDRGGKQG